MFNSINSAINQAYQHTQQAVTNASPRIKDGARMAMMGATLYAYKAAASYVIDNDVFSSRTVEEKEATNTGLSIALIAVTTAAMLIHYTCSSAKTQGGSAVASVSAQASSQSVGEINSSAAVSGGGRQ